MNDEHLPPEFGATAPGAANQGQIVLVTQQTIYQNGRPRWIQELGLEDLEQARDRLYSASRRHENRAFAALLLPVVVAMLAIAGLSVYIKHLHQDIPMAVRVMMVVLCGLVAIPVWFGLYDAHRRHRKVVAAAESRWAEIVVEIALRTKLPRTRYVLKHQSCQTSGIGHPRQRTVP